jgi:hypothetical protein
VDVAGKLCGVGIGLDKDLREKLERLTGKLKQSKE